MCLCVCTRKWACIGRLLWPNFSKIIASVCLPPPPKNRVFKDSLFSPLLWYSLIIYKPFESLEAFVKCVSFLLILQHHWNL